MSLLQRSFLVNLMLISLICHSNAGYAQFAIDNVDKVQLVPLPRLIATPEKFHNEKVMVSGFVLLEFEADLIFPYKEDFLHGNQGNGVWLNIDRSAKERKTHNLQYCLIQGTFDAKSKGHGSMWSGTITNITRFEVLDSKVMKSGKKKKQE